MVNVGRTRVSPVVVGTLNPRVTGYRIEEIVTKDGLYITWDGLYATKESAEQQLTKMGYERYGTYFERPTDKSRNESGSLSQTLQNC